MDSTQTIVTEVQWDWSKLLDGPAPSAFVVSGRSLREYSFPLNEEIRRRGGIVIEDANDLEAAIRRVVSPMDVSYASRLLQPVPDRIVGRFEVARRRGDLSEWDVGEYSSRFLFDDWGLETPELLNSAINQAASAFENTLISYNHHTSHLSYFRLLLPLIVKRCKQSRWIIIATDRVGESNIFTHVKRDYVERDILIQVLGTIARLDSATIESIIATHASESRRYAETPTSEMTLGEFEQALSAYKGIVLPRVAQYIPLVPSPDSAPLEFDFKDERLVLLDEKLPQKISSPVLSSVIEELLEQIDHVSKHFHLHNIAPACSSKLDRVRDNLKDIRESGLNEARVIKLGISTQATQSHLRFERENIEQSAEGSIVSAVGQVDVFLNRFRAWRSYLQDSELEAPGRVEEQSTSAAAAILNSVADCQGLGDDATVFALKRAGFEATSSASSDVERRGVLRIVHNLTSNLLGQLRDIIRDRNTRRGGNFEQLLWSTIKLMEPQLTSLAGLFPTMFAWTTHLINWMRAMGMG